MTTCTELHGPPGPGRLGADAPDSTRGVWARPHEWLGITSGTAFGQPGGRHQELTERPTCSLFCSAGRS